MGPTANNDTLKMVNIQEEIDVQFVVFLSGHRRREKGLSSTPGLFFSVFFVTHLSTVFLECNLESRTRYVWYHALEDFFFVLSFFHVEQNTIHTANQFIQH